MRGGKYEFCSGGRRLEIQAKIDVTIVNLKCIGQPIGWNSGRVSQLQP